MGLSYRYQPDDDLLVTVGNGHVTSRDLAAFARSQMEDPNWPFGARRLADLTTVTSGVTSEEADDVARLYGVAHPRRRGVRQAIVASPRWDLANAFAHRIDGLGIPTVVFDSLGVACSWLGSDAAIVAQVVREQREQLRRDRN